MFGILGEDISDVAVIDVLIKKIANNQSLRTRPKGYSGCGELLSKGARGIKALNDVGFSKFIICYDADKGDPARKYDEVVQKIIKPSGVASSFCAIVPTQEIESWLLSDLSAIKKIFSSFKFDREYSHPESQDDPKEHLEKILRKANNKPCYISTAHNSKIAAHVDLINLVEKCPSSIPLFDFIQTGNGNYPDQIQDYKEAKKRVLKALRGE
ncbi:DUF4276 family protein [Oxalobacteraceae sp. CFBP 13730]|nr:DUF4276 family protein [Oxalobacteraceae sp. CFBP 13730]